MNVRGLLRNEIWSKRTTRRILVLAGFVFAVLILGFYGWSEISRHWLTKGERTAAKVALQRLDALRNADALSDEEFKVLDDKAQSAVDAAARAARTKKDELNHTRLVVCWMGLGLTRIKVVEQELLEQGKFDVTAKSWEWQQQSGVLTDAIAHESCLALHKELN